MIHHAHFTRISIFDQQRGGWLKQRHPEDDGYHEFAIPDTGGTCVHETPKGLYQDADERPDPEIDDQRRRYYRMTSLGRRYARQYVDRGEEQAMTDGTESAA